MLLKLDQTEGQSFITTVIINDTIRTFIEMKFTSMFFKVGKLQLIAVKPTNVIEELSVTQEQVTHKK